MHIFVLLNLCAFARDILALRELYFAFGEVIYRVRRGMRCRVLGGAYKEIPALKKKRRDEI